MATEEQITELVRAIRSYRNVYQPVEKCFITDCRACKRNEEVKLRLEKALEPFGEVR